MRFGACLTIRKRANDGVMWPGGNSVSLPNDHPSPSLSTHRRFIMRAHTLLLIVTLGIVAIPSASHARGPLRQQPVIVTGVPAQPLLAQVRRVREAMKALGSPL